MKLRLYCMFFVEGRINFEMDIFSLKKNGVSNRRKERVEIRLYSAETSNEFQFGDADVL